MKKKIILNGKKQNMYAYGNEEALEYLQYWLDTKDDLYDKLYFMLYGKHDCKFKAIGCSISGRIEALIMNHYLKKHNVMY